MREERKPRGYGTRLLRRQAESDRLLQVRFASWANGVKALIDAAKTEDERRDLAEKAAEIAAGLDRKYPTFDRKTFLDACGL